MNNINTVYTLGEDPMECPRCMSRTEFDQLPNKQEVHTCLGCGFKFIAEEDPDGT
jgi:rubredoxin